MARLLMAIVIVFLCCHSTKIVVNFYEAYQVCYIVIMEQYFIFIHSDHDIWKALRG